MTYQGISFEQTHLVFPTLRSKSSQIKSLDTYTIFLIQVFVFQTLSKEILRLFWPYVTVSIDILGLVKVMAVLAICFNSEMFSVFRAPFIHFQNCIYFHSG